MLGIFFSTVQEASYFLKLYKKARFEGISDGEFAHDNRIMVGITGIGKIKATLHTERFLQQLQPDRLLHLGYGTKLNLRLDSGTLVSIHQAFEGDRTDLLIPTYPKMPLSCPFPELFQGSLVTQDAYTQTSDGRKYWERLADVSDTEGYAIAFVAASRGIPCHIVKVALGDTKETGLTIKKMIDHASKSISDLLLAHLLKI